MAAVDKTLIANLALSHIRDKGVLEDVDTDTSTRGKTAKLWYDPARKQALADYDFGFSRKRLILATHSEDPPAEWAFRYQWPADCIQARYLQNPIGRRQAPLPFEIEQADDGTMSILCDLDEAVLVYSRDVEDTTFFTPHFVLAHSYLLAHYLAGPITGKKSIQDQMMQNYNNAIAVGAAHEANVTARGTEGQPEAPWILER